MSQLNYKESTVGRARRVVIKVGSAVLSDADGLRAGVIDLLSAQIESAVSAGREIVIVTSGAVAAGRARLSKLQSATIAARQAAAATGQIELMSAWARAFNAHNRADFADASGFGRAPAASECESNDHRVARRGRDSDCQ